MEPLSIGLKPETPNEAAAQLRDADANWTLV